MTKNSVVLMFAVSLLFFARICTANDHVTFDSRGNVFVMEIYRNASSGAYLFTRLLLAEKPDDDTLFPVPNDLFVVNCNGNEGGDKTNCLYTSAFFGSSGCLPLQHTSFGPFFVGHPIQQDVMMERYTCKSGAQKDAGECVQFQGSILHVFTQSTGNQVLWPWVEDIDFESLSACTNK